MHEEPTTVIIQRYLDALPGDTAAEPVVRELLERAAGRLRLLGNRGRFELLAAMTGQQFRTSPISPKPPRRCRA
jgi:hypothetical protein